MRINLGNIHVAKVEKKSLIDNFLMLFAKEAVAQSKAPPAGVTAVYLAAFNSNNQVLTEKTIAIENYPANSIVDFAVPAGQNITLEIRAFQDLAIFLTGEILDRR